MKNNATLALQDHQDGNIVKLKSRIMILQICYIITEPNQIVVHTYHVVHTIQFRKNHWDRKPGTVKLLLNKLNWTLFKPEDRK